MVPCGESYDERGWQRIVKPTNGAGSFISKFVVVKVMAEKRIAPALRSALVSVRRSRRLRGYDSTSRERCREANVTSCLGFDFSPKEGTLPSCLGASLATTSLFKLPLTITEFAKFVADFHNHSQEGNYRKILPPATTQVFTEKGDQVRIPTHASLAVSESG